jgi:hypothetical protein
MMIERWDILAQIARVCGDWDETQRRMARDLLGIAGSVGWVSATAPEPATIPLTIAQ